MCVCVCVPVWAAPTGDQKSNVLCLNDSSRGEAGARGEDERSRVCEKEVKYRGNKYQISGSFVSNVSEDVIDEQEAKCVLQTNVIFDWQLTSEHPSQLWQVRYTSINTIHIIWFSFLHSEIGSPEYIVANGCLIHAVSLHLNRSASLGWLTKNLWHRRFSSHRSNKLPVESITHANPLRSMVVRLFFYHFNLKRRHQSWLSHSQYPAPKPYLLNQHHFFSGFNVYWIEHFIRCPSVHFSPFNQYSMWLPPLTTSISTRISSTLRPNPICLCYRFLKFKKCSCTAGIPNIIYLLYEMFGCQHYLTQRADTFCHDGIEQVFVIDKYVYERWHIHHGR